MPKMIRKYERMLEQGLYANENELCNALGLNYEDIYEDEAEEDDEPQKPQNKNRKYGNGEKRRK